RGRALRALRDPDHGSSSADGRSELPFQIHRDRASPGGWWERHAMKTARIALVTVVAGLIATTLAVTGCSKSLKNTLIPNIPPTVRLTSAPYDTTNRYFYAYKLDWIGNDPDGRVDYFLYSIDPDLNNTGKISWTKTTKNEQIIFFRATSPDPQDSTV